MIMIHTQVLSGHRSASANGTRAILRDEQRLVFDTPGVFGAWSGSVAAVAATSPSLGSSLTTLLHQVNRPTDHAHALTTFGVGPDEVVTHHAGTTT